MARSFDALSYISIRKKLLLSSVLVVILACLLVSVYLIHNTAQLLQENMLSHSAHEITAIADGFENALTNQYNLLINLSEYTPLINYLETEHASSYNLYQNYSATLMQWNKWLRSSNLDYQIKIYMDVDYQSIASLTNGRISQLLRTDWFDPDDHRTCAIASPYMLISTPWETKYTDTIVYYRNIWDAAGQSLRRVITIAQAAEHLREDIHTEASEYYLVNPDGIVACSNVSGTQGLPVEQLFPMTDAADMDKGEVARQNDHQYYIRRVEFRPQSAGLPDGWQIVYRQDFSENSREIQRQIITCAAICVAIVLACICVALAITRNITSRLHLLLLKIGRLNVGDFSQQDVISGTDEISSISASFDEMSTHINELIEERERTYENQLYLERRENELMMNWRDSEYQVLRAQINPHYLYNTLESIRMSLLLGQGKEAVRIMRIFADSIREYMNVDRLSAALRDELHFIGYYAEILRFRMGERFRFALDVNEDLLDLEIPRLILQPLVENAVNHGIDKKVEGGEVRLSAEAKGEWLVCRVSDDGVGMEEEMLRRTRKALAAGEKVQGQLGLWNINRRLMLLYGPEHGLEIESKAGVGTVITVAFRISDGAKGEGDDV